MHFKSRCIVLFGVMFLTFALDQITKPLVRANMKDEEAYHFVNDFVTLVKTENTGAFLGIGQELPPVIKRILLNIIPISVMILLSIYALKRKNANTFILIGYGCILGGGLGNVLDRLLYGSVTDLIHLTFYGFQTGIFNFADLSVTAGIIILVVERARNRQPNEWSGD